MIRRALILWSRRERLPFHAPRCGLCGKAWPIPTASAILPSDDGRRAVLRPVCVDCAPDQHHPEGRLT